MSEFTDGLRAMADWFDQHPEWEDDAAACTSVVLTADKLAAFALAMGKSEKEADEHTFGLRRRFAKSVSLRGFTWRDAVCERVKVGERTVSRLVPPEGVQMVEVDEVEDVYEWRCPESILRPQGEPGGDSVLTDDELDAMAEAAS